MPYSWMMPFISLVELACFPWVYCSGVERARKKKHPKEDGGEDIKWTRMPSMIEPLLLSEYGPSLIFLHANGYPPEAYRAFLDPFLDLYRVEAPYMRPFWPGTDPEDIRDWLGFRDDYLDYLTMRDQHCQTKGTDSPTSRIIGVGHSLGAMSTVMAAIKAPDLFIGLVLIEPVLFSRAWGILMRLTRPFRLLHRFHPLIKGTLKRRTSFPDQEAMFQNYRKKPIFQGISDMVLRDYVQGLAGVNSDGSIFLRYPPEWEARVYELSGLADWYVWRNLSRIDMPVLVIRGARTDTLWASTLDQMVRKLPQGTPVTVEEVGHLAPLEKPDLVAEIVMGFIRSAIESY
jgi:pimeloyl-ACP methyl ester carboxylesterase